MKPELILGLALGFSMLLTKLLEPGRRVAVRTGRLVNDTMVGACLGRGMDFEEYISGEA